MTLSEFYKKLKYHDWFYEYSDDHSVWTRGNAALAELRRLARTSPEHESLFADYRAAVISGKQVPPAPSED